MLKSKFEGKTRIFVREVEGRTIYSTQLSQKNLKGEWENIYINVRFKKDVKIDNETDIQVNNAWLTFYKGEKGKPTYSIFINDFETSGTNSENTEEVFDEAGSDLPF